MLGTIVVVLAAVPLVPTVFLLIIRIALVFIGHSLKAKTDFRRQAIYTQSRREQKIFEKNLANNEDWEKVEHDRTSVHTETQDWSGIVGFFHPFCNAGGGGERVLWAAIAAIQQRYPQTICAVYTGDHEIERSAMVKRVKTQFEITIHEPTLHFVYLSRRQLVVASSFPHFTLLGQSVGSMILASEAFSLLVPDIFIDTMGYAFAVGLCHFLFPKVPTAAYVHYPTISTDMLESLDDTTGVKGIHSGRGTGLKGRAKKYYWRLFAWVYGWVGRRIDIVMCNSSWTRGHITQLWNRGQSHSQATVIYPPCPVSKITRQIEVSAETEKNREDIFLYIAQFRPEKNHFLILNAFSKYCRSLSKSDTPQRLAFIGSVRTGTHDEKLVYRLRLEARALGINDKTDFIINASFDTIMSYLRKASVGVNGMYSEHFGIGNVEGQAAGLILVCHNSGGPKLDICVPLNGKSTGFLAENEDEYAIAFRKYSELSQVERLEMRLRARESANRFTDEIFAENWIGQFDRMVLLWKNRR